MLLEIKVKEETVVEGIMSAEENKEEAKVLKDKLRPTDLSKIPSKFQKEEEVLFAPLSSFKIDNIPQKMVHGNNREYYRIQLEYIDTFIPTKEMVFMNAANEF